MMIGAEIEIAQIYELRDKKKSIPNHMATTHDPGERHGREALVFRLGSTFVFSIVWQQPGRLSISFKRKEVY